MSLGCSKKGNVILDGMLIIIGIIVMIIAAVALYPALQAVNEDVQNNTAVYDNETRAYSENAVDTYPSLVDNIVIVALVLLWILSLILAAYIDSNPMFFVIVIILFVAVLVGTVLIADATTEMLGSDLNAFPMCAWVLNNIAYLLIGFFVTIGISMYLGNRT